MSEHDHQVALMAWAIKSRSRLPQLEMLFAIPNGGHRSAVAGAKLKAEGVRRGVPDLCLPVPCGGFNGLFIELKAGKGRASPEQKQWLANLASHGYMAVLCFGWEEAAKTIDNYLGG